MSLLADIEEFKTHWKGSSLVTKAVLLFGAILTFGEISSLAEKIVSIRGFFRDGIEFFRAWISEPLCHFFASFNIHLLPTAVDGFVLVFLVVAAALRAEVILDPKFTWWQAVLGLVAFAPINLYIWVM